MNETTLQYIASRAEESETGSIKAVSCPDIRALLAERAELLSALELGRYLLTIPAMQEINNPAIADFDRLSAAAIAKAK